MSVELDLSKAVRVAEAYCYDAGAPNAAKNLRAAVAALIAERDALREDVERLQADGVHTCGTHCQRIACVLRRERDALRAAARYMARVWVLSDEIEQSEADVDACIQRMTESAAKRPHQAPAAACDGILRGNADLVPTAHATLGAPEPHA